MTPPNALDALREHEKCLEFARNFLSKDSTEEQIEMMAAVLEATRKDALAQHALASEAAAPRDLTEEEIEHCLWTEDGEEFDLKAVTRRINDMRRLASPSGQPAREQMSVLKQVGTGGAGDYPANEYSPASQNDALAALKAEVRLDELLTKWDRRDASEMLNSLGSEMRGFPNYASKLEGMAQMQRICAEELRAALAAPPAVTRRTEAEVRREVIEECAKAICRYCEFADKPKSRWSKANSNGKHFDDRGVEQYCDAWPIRQLASLSEQPMGMAGQTSTTSEAPCHSQSSPNPSGQPAPICPQKICPGCKGRTTVRYSRQDVTCGMCGGRGFIVTEHEI